MKRFVCLLLIAAAVLCGCSGGENRFEADAALARESVTAYLGEHMGTDAALTGFKIQQVQSSADSATITCSVSFTDEASSQSGTFLLTYGLEKGKWILRSCRLLRETPVATESTQPSGEAVDASHMSIPEDALRYGGHSYYVYDDNTIRTWEDAQIFCESLGGYLAVIASDAENSALYEYVKSRGYTQVFFGFSDAGHEGIWKWVPQEESSYRNWHPGQPNGGEKDNYAQFVDEYVDGSNSHTGEWSDSIYGAAHIYVFLCEWPAE